MLHLLFVGIVALLLPIFSVAQFSTTPAANAGAPGSTSASGSEETVHKVGNGVSEPKVIIYNEALYPESKDGEHIQANGNCLISIIVGTDGKPQKVHAIRCTNLVFEKNSVDAVSTYRFKPAHNQDGKPVPVVLSVEVKFRRSDASNTLNFCQPDGSGTPILHLVLEISKSSASNEPDSQGFYPLGPGLVSPKLIRFEDRSFCETAFTTLQSSCSVPLTLDSKGKIKVTETPQCSQKNLTDRAFESVSKSKFQPATLNGKPVGVRTVMKLSFGEETVTRQRLLLLASINISFYQHSLGQQPLRQEQETDSSSP